MCFLVTHLSWDSDQMHTTTLELEDSHLLPRCRIKMLSDNFLISSTTEFRTIPPSTCQWSCWQLVFMPRYVIYLVQETWPHLEQFSFPIHFWTSDLLCQYWFHPLQPSNSMFIDKGGDKNHFSLSSTLSPLLLQPQTPSPALIILWKKKKSVLLIWHFLHVSAPV